MKTAGLWAAILLMTAMSGLSQSESVRPLYVRENRFPELGKAEVGLIVGYARNDEYFLSQVDDTAYADQGYRFVDKEDKLKVTTFTPYARYGIFDNLTVFARVPVSSQKSDAKDETETGLNDVTLGFELLAYEYTYTYPWVIPYVELTFPTGDEDEGMGLGEMDGIFGVAVGTTTFDKYTWVLDGRYDVNRGDDGRFEGAAAVIWALSDQFSVLAEARVTDKDDNSPDDLPVYINGGLCYRPAEALSVNLYGGASVNAEEDGHGALKLAYSF